MLIIQQINHSSKEPIWITSLMNVLLLWMKLPPIMTFACSKF